MIVKITIDHNLYMVLESVPNDLNKIDLYFTYEDMSKCFVNGSFRPERIQKQKFLVRSPSIKTQALLPIGFKKELETFLKKNKAKYKFIDKRSRDDFNFTEEEIKSSLDYLEMYDYQIEAVQKALQHKSGIVKSPTGSGKCVTGDTEIEIEFDDNEIDL